LPHIHHGTPLAHGSRLKLGWEAKGIADGDAKKDMV
jgi:hypothetical protein